MLQMCLRNKDKVLQYLKGHAGELPEISAKQLGALNVVGAVQLLVDRVSTIGGATHGQQENILVEGILESQSHGNGSSLAGQVGLDLEDALNSLGSSHWIKRRNISQLRVKI